MELQLNQLAVELLRNIDAVWAFILLLTRYTGMILVLPGIGGGERGYAVRFAAVLVFALCSVNPATAPALPADLAVMAAQLVLELIFGLALGFVPFMIVAGAQMAGQISSSSMGLSASNLIDPTLGAPSPDLARIFSDLSIVLFLLLDGHHAVIYVASGATGHPPGSLAFQDLSLKLLIDLSASIFHSGVLIAAPVIVALLLTQFVMGLVTKAVPTVNVFIVSFPLTVGIGLILTMLSLPEVLNFMQHRFSGLDSGLAAIVERAGP